jgi:hypothetical protein
MSTFEDVEMFLKLLSLSLDTSGRQNRHIGEVCTSHKLKELVGIGQAGTGPVLGRQELGRYWAGSRNWAGIGQFTVFIFEGCISSRLLLIIFGGAFNRNIFSRMFSLLFHTDYMFHRPVWAEISFTVKFEFG